MMFALCYSVYSARSDSTGSFRAAIPEGIKPAVSVKTTLMIISVTAAPTGKVALTIKEVNRWCSSRLIGIRSNAVIPIPRSPAVSPTIKVSALKTLDISFFEAPIARRIPISFHLSRTDLLHRMG